MTKIRKTPRTSVIARLAPHLSASHLKALRAALSKQPGDTEFTALSAGRIAGRTITVRQSGPDRFDIDIKDIEAR